MNKTPDKLWKDRIARCKVERKELIPLWQDLIDARRGKYSNADDVDQQFNISPDWSLTRSKTASLFSQVPEVRLLPKNEAFNQAVPAFAKEVNTTLKKADVGTAVNDAVVDMVNPSGFGVAMVEYVSLTDKRDVPTVDAATAQQMQQAGQEVPTQKMDVVVDSKFIVRKVSPADFLWPVEFSSSNFDAAPWLGISGSMFWSEAKNTLRLKDEDKEKVVGTAKPTDETLSDQNHTLNAETDVVRYDEVFYWAYRFDSEEKSFKKIRRIVFVEGLEEPVIHEDWTGQKFDEQTGQYAGSCKFPIRVLTQDYLTGEAIPPSDSAMGKPHVVEMQEFRKNLKLQRQRSQHRQSERTDAHCHAAGTSGGLLLWHRRGPRWPTQLVWQLEHET